jgi:hypothetical protein
MLRLSRLFCFYGIILLVLPARGEDNTSWPTREDLLILSWKNSGIDPTETIEWLRSAVTKNPHDVELSAALIHMLSIYGHRDDEADQAARVALKFNPQNPTLLIARAAALRPSPALDVLEELAKVPDQKEQAQRLSEIASLGLPIPQNFYWEQPETYVAWADRLIFADKIDRAAAVLAEGIQRSTGKKEREIPLQQRKAIVLALQKKFDSALELQKQIGFPQVDIEAKYTGMGDVLLVMQQSQLAIDSFGGDPHGGTKVLPENLGDAEFRDREHVRVFAWACALSGQEVRAESQLVKNDDLYDRLLLIRVYLNSTKSAAAREVGDRIVGPLKLLQGSYSGPPLPRYGAAASLAPQYMLAVKWLLEQYPQKNELIKMYVGSPDYAELKYCPFQINIESTSELLPKLQAQLAAAQATNDEQKIRLARGEQLRALADDHRYKDAAAALAEAAIAPPSRWNREHLRISDDAVKWCIMNRRADAELLFEKDPDALKQAYELLEIAHARRWNEPHIDDSLTTEQRIEKLSQLGPGVLAAVFQDFQPNTISGEDRTLYVRVIQNIGGPQDAPVLIDTLGLLAPEPFGSHHPLQAQIDADDASDQAIQTCLEKITGQYNPRTNREDRLDFWLHWWEANGQKIIQSVQ